MTKRRGNGEGTIGRRADGRWMAMVSTGNHRKAYYGKTRVEVAQKMAAALKARQDGFPVASDRHTVAAYLSSWLAATRASVRPATARRYEQYVRVHAAPSLGRIALTRLTPQHLQALYTERLAAGCSPTTVAHLHAVLHRALKQATLWGMCARNVATLASPPRMSRRQMTALAPEQARLLLGAIADDRREALYVLALTSGMRQGELLGLRWADIDLEERSVHVHASLQRSARASPSSSRRPRGRAGRSRSRTRQSPLCAATGRRSYRSASRSAPRGTI